MNNTSEQQLAFAAFREAIKPWRNVNPSQCEVALGGDASDGGWSVVFENGHWLVFIGERGERFSMSNFMNVWDALSYAGYRVTNGLQPKVPFPVLYPNLHLVNN